MTSVLGMADLLANEGLGERHHHYVQTIRASGRHLLALINDILDFSRIESGRLELEHIDFSLASLCAEVRTLLAQQAEDHGLDLAFDVSADVPPMVRGDPTRVRQMLLNLVGNALKFTRDGSVRVGVGSSPLGDRHVCVRLEVRDTGIGIPLDRQASLFEPFSQAETSTMRRYGGTGLGLAICRRLIDAMGGAIGLESVPGEGSLFWFEIPLEIGEATLDARPSAVNGAAVIPLRVLVVDDVWTNRELLGAMLGQQGHEVLFAEDGAEAVRLVGEERLDLVLMDVRMPVLDGVEATRRIRAMSAPAASVPILGLTANIMEDEHRRYVSAGMDMILTKPVIWPDLFAVIAAVAEGRGSASRPAAS
jgi:CheY-like chemotaxis protein